MTLKGQLFIRFIKHDLIRDCKIDVADDSAVDETKKEIEEAQEAQKEDISEQSLAHK
jgi:hypothetical protein